MESYMDTAFIIDVERARSLLYYENNVNSIAGVDLCLVEALLNP